MFRRPRWRTIHIENVLGTSLELQIAGVRDADVSVAEHAALDEIDRLAAILSTYSADSELANWQATLDIDVGVSRELAEVLDVAEQWRVRTNGAFNAAAVAIIDRLKAATAIDASFLANIQRPLWRVDRIRGVARRFVDVPMSLDAVAKGYIVSRAAERARQATRASNVLLNVGGDIQHLGSSSVTVGIADPRRPSENAPPIASVSIRDAALATSGGYRRGFSAGGVWHSHIIDPRVGAESSSGILSASVIAPDCATADVLSTVFSVIARDESLALADSMQDVACLLVERDGRVSMSRRWNAR